jgi:ribose transport system substrate-binding protein
LNVNRREFLKKSTYAAAAGLLAQQGLSIASAQESQTYYMVSFLSGIDYWKDCYRGMQDAAAFLGVEAIYTGTPEYDITAEVRVLEETLAQEPDGVLLTVINPEALKPTIDTAIAGGLPLVTFDADSPLSSRYSFLGTGNYYAGVVAARYLGPKIGNGKAVVITVPSQGNLLERTNGFINTLQAEFPDAVTGSEYIIDNQNAAQKAASDLSALIQAESDIKGVFSSNAEAAIGGAQALREAGMSADVHHIGFDYNEGTLDLIDSGELGATLAQGTWQMGFWGMMSVYMVKNAKIASVSDWQAAGISPLPPVVDTGVVVINKDNSQYWRAS